LGEVCDERGVVCRVPGERDLSWCYVGYRDVGDFGPGECLGDSARQEDDAAAGFDVFEDFFHVSDEGALSRV